MILEHTNYRTYLKAVLADRVGRNSSYSLRALARDLGLHPAHLSAIHKGKKNLSLANAMQVAQHLGLSASEAEYFCVLVQYENTDSAELRESFRLRLSALGQRSIPAELSLDLFKIIADWYHIPILMLTDVPGADFTPANLAKKFGISALEAEVALERLQRLELLQKSEDGKFSRWQQSGLFKSKIPNSALRRFHKQMLNKAADSLDAQLPKDRYIGSETLAIHPEQLPAVAKLVSEFRSSLVELLNERKDATDVYHLEVVFFNLTHTKDGNPETNGRNNV